MIYLYAIVEPTASPPDCRGLDDAPLALLHGAATALYSEHSHLECRPEPDALWRHELVVERAMGNGAVLPARFGTTFVDTDALTDALARAASRLLGQLERVRGCVELAVRLGLPASSGPEPHDGGAYLHAKLARRRERHAAAEATLTPLSRLAVDTRRHEGSSDSAVMTASYLVAEHGVDRFADEVRRLARRNDGLLLSCTGPWAPYSFAEVQT
jgi:Gas vesicle synthesis protein GvpL/GvpF